MSGLKAYVADIPESALKYISEALDVYGVGQVKIEELDLANSPSSKLSLRRSSDDNSVLAVILGEVGYERGKSVQKNLYDSSKFHRYHNDRDLVLYLNDAHDAELEVPEVPTVDVALSYSDNQQGLDDSFNVESSNPSGAIEENRNSGALLLENRELYNRLEEQKRYISELESEEPTVVVDESKILDLKNKLSLLESKNEQYKAHNTKLTNDNKSLDLKLRSYKSASEQKETENEALKAKNRGLDLQVQDLERLKGKNQELRDELRDLRTDLTDAYTQVRNANKLNSEFTKTISDIRANASTSQTDKDEITRLRSEIEKVQGESGKIQTRLDKALEQIEDFKKYDEQREKEFEEEKTGALKSQASDYESQLASRDSTIQGYIKQNNELRNNQTPEVDTGAIEAVAGYESSIFYQISKTATPASGLPKLEIGNVEYRNITFVFSGARVSATETMKKIRDNSYSVSNESPAGTIIVDISNNTDTDYIFGGRVSSDGVAWAEGKKSFISMLNEPSNNDTVRYFSLGGTQYLNDTYVLNVDWLSRLNELEHSGHKVIIYAGCISDLVGRIMYNTFSNKATTRIYVLGRLVNMREAIFNLTGIKKSDRTTVHIYDFIRTRNSEQVLNTFSKLNYTAIIDSEKQGNK